MQSLLNIGPYIVELFLLIQVALTVYLLFLLVKWREPKLVICVYILIMVLFIGLKLHFIPYELGGILDQFLRGTYNILYIIFVIYILIDAKWKT